jgi:hypothetical protein
MLTSKGFERLEELEAGNPESAQGFIAMWFATEMAEASIAIEGAVSDAGYAPLRIDKKEHNNDISDEIIAEIRRSRFLIADATCGSVTPEGNSHPIGVLRGGVYYEAGFATGLNIPVIWSCREDCIGFVHFDTRQYAHVLWNEPSQLRVALKNRIVAVAGWGPLARPDQAIAPQQV